MKIKLLVIGFIISLIGCAFFAYLWIDRSITLAYVEQSAETNSKSIERLSYLLESEWLGMSEDKILQKLKNEVVRHPKDEIIIKKEESIIWFDEVMFKMESGRLIKINR